MTRDDIKFTATICSGLLVVAVVCATLHSCTQEAGGAIVEAAQVLAEALDRK